MRGGRTLPTAMTAGTRAGRTGAAALPASATATRAGSPSVAAGPGWHTRVLAHVSIKTVAETVSPSRDAAYTLVSRGTPGLRPFRLERIGLRHGTVRRGPLFPAEQIRLAGGYLWVSGPVPRPRRQGA